MSFDLLLKTDCPHYIYDEYNPIIDRKRIFINTFVLNELSLVLKINGYTVNRDEGLFAYSLKSTAENLFYIEFINTLRSEQYWAEVSYLTKRETCPRCRGTGKEYDPKTSADGKFYRVINEEKLAQDIEKWVFTERGSNKYRLRIGTDIVVMLGEKAFPGFDLVLKDQILDVLDLARSVQLSKVNYQNITDREVLGDVIAVTLEQDEFDPRITNIIIDYTSRFGENQQVGSKFRTNFRR